MFKIKVGTLAAWLGFYAPLAVLWSTKMNEWASELGYWGFCIWIPLAMLTVAISRILNR